jgi:hypothetical protein
MSSVFSEADLTSLTEGIDKLRHSARRTVPMFAIGILSTVVAAGIAIWFIFTLSANLEEARTALRVSDAKLAAALENLQVANRALEQASQAAVTPGSQRQIAAAISDVSRSQKDLAVVSASLKVATDKLPPASAAEQVAASKLVAEGTGWFAVMGSYPLNASGLDAAQARIRQIQATGQCAELWQTQISRNYAVVLGSSTSRDGAALGVKRARTSGMAGDAFTQRDRDWSRLPQSPAC